METVIDTELYFYPLEMYLPIHSLSSCCCKTEHLDPTDQFVFFLSFKFPVAIPHSNLSETEFFIL